MLKKVSPECVLLRLSSGIIACILTLSCARESTRILLNKPTLIKPSKPLVMVCIPPITRKRNAASIQLAIDGTWELTSDCLGIKLANGSRVAIEILLEAKDDTIYRANMLGASGCSLDISFSQVPMDQEIKKLIIRSDAPLRLLQVSWRNYNPI